MTAENMLRSVSFLLFYMKEHFMVPGKIENMVVVFDLNYAMPWHLETSALKILIEVLSLVFRCHTAKAIILNASRAFYWTWSTIKQFLNEM